jgi:ribosomal protein S18 acetylase RimI-like enzyme
MKRKKIVKFPANDHFTLAAYQDRHFEGVKALWQDAFPEIEAWRAPEVAIPAKLAIQPDLFLIATDGDQVIGTTLAGYDGHRGWLYSVAVLSGHRRRGVGTALLREAERRLLALGCAKIGLQIVPENEAVVEFYRRAGYDVEPKICMGKKIGIHADVSSLAQSA